MQICFLNSDELHIKWWGFSVVDIHLICSVDGAYIHLKNLEVLTCLQENQKKYLMKCSKVNKCQYRLRCAYNTTLMYQVPNGNHFCTGVIHLILLFYFIFVFVMQMLLLRCFQSVMCLLYKCSSLLLCYILVKNMYVQFCFISLFSS